MKERDAATRPKGNNVPVAAHALLYVSAYLLYYVVGRYVFRICHLKPGQACLNGHITIN
jgi:hypothetical protein